MFFRAQSDGGHFLFPPLHRKAGVPCVCVRVSVSGGLVQNARVNRAQV